MSSIAILIDAHNLRLQKLDDNVYLTLAREVIAKNEEMAKKVRADLWSAEGADGKSKSKGKIMFFVGQMMKRSNEDEGLKGRIEPTRAEEAVRKALPEKIS